MHRLPQGLLIHIFAKAKNLGCKAPTREKQKTWLSTILICLLLYRLVEKIKNTVK